MASIVLLKNPLAPHEREIHPVASGSAPIDWLQANHPDGFGMPVRYFVGDEEHDLDDLDRPMQEDDVVILAVMPATGGVLETVLISLAIAAIVGVATYFLGGLFAPEQNRKGQGDKESVYEVSSAQNAARPGAPVPVVYGEVLTTPDYVAQPYTYYETDMSKGTGTASANSRLQALGVQYLDLLLCLGQGVVTPKKIYIGETEYETFKGGGTYQPEEINYKVFYPDSSADLHNNTMGTISSSVNFQGAHAFSENVVTSTEVSNQEFTQQGQRIGPFTTSKIGMIGSVIEVDIVFPGGLFYTQSDGDVVGISCPLDLEIEELGDDGLPVAGTKQIINYVVSTNGSNWGNDLPGAPHSVRTGQRNGVFRSDLQMNTPKNDPLLNAPIRITLTETMSKSARWSVAIRRTYSQHQGNRGQSKFMWTSLRLYADYPTTKVYSDCTLMAVRIKATNAIGPDASVRVSTLVSRWVGKLADVNGYNHNPADAFADIYTNATYGAGRPRTELDLTKLTSLRSNWSPRTFNHEFRSRTTVWNALSTSVIGMVAEPLPIGALMSVAQDGVKSARSMMFTEANIVQDSMSLSFGFDPIDAFDGVEVEYKDPLTFKPRQLRWPTTALNPEEFVIPGCTDADYALRYAKTWWNRRLHQRQLLKFETELEGIILQLGDRIGVTHQMPRWGQSGFVLRQTGNVLTVDQKLDWTHTTPAIMLRDEDGTPSSILPVTRGASDYEVDLGAAAPFTIHIEDGQEFTSYAFGELNTFVRDYTVATTRPMQDGTVEVEAVNYDERVFADGHTFLGGTQSGVKMLAAPAGTPQASPVTYAPATAPTLQLRADVSMPPPRVKDIDAEITFRDDLPASKAYTITIVSRVHGHAEVSQTASIDAGDAAADIARKVAAAITDPAVKAHANAGAVTVDPVHGEWIEKLEVTIA